MRRKERLSILADRIMSALLAVAITAALGAAIWRFAPERTLFSEQQLKRGLVYEASGVAADEIVAYLDGNGATAEMYACLFAQECDSIESGFYISLNDMWDTELENNRLLSDFVRENVLDRVKQQLLLENLSARCGVELTDADKKQMDEARAFAVSQAGGETEYREELYKMGLRETGYERLVRDNFLYEHLCELANTPGSELYASDDTLRAYAEGAGWITADHILLATIDLNTHEKLDDDTVAQKRQLAEDILAQLRESSDPAALFSELADQYSEDTGRLSNPDGYTFTHGTMVTEFDDAAHALAEGEYSDIVETTYGYHIILRKHLDVAKAVEAVRDEYFDRFFQGELEKSELEITDAVMRIDSAALYNAFQTARHAGEEADGQSGTGGEN